MVSSREVKRTGEGDHRTVCFGGNGRGCKLRSLLTGEAVHKLKCHGQSQILVILRAVVTCMGTRGAAWPVPRWFKWWQAVVVITAVLVRGQCLAIAEGGGGGERRAAPALHTVGSTDYLGSTEEYPAPVLGTLYCVPVVPNHYEPISIDFLSRMNRRSGWLESPFTESVFQNSPS